MKRFLTLIVAAMITTGAWAQVWTESGDAPSFPDGAAQVTRGAGLLNSITGTISNAEEVRLDAYCINILDPAAFLATTDPQTAPTANADISTSLFLFRPGGAPVLAADNSMQSGLTTLRGVATDGSGFVLTQPGEYVLVIGSGGERPLDAANIFIFDAPPPALFVYAPDLDAGRFDRWNNSNFDFTATYAIVLEGVGPCQDNLDAVFVNIDAGGETCLGGGNEGLACSSLLTRTGQGNGVELGFVNGDPSLDAVIAEGFPSPSQLCRGDGNGTLSCETNFPESPRTNAVALGHVNHDQHLDAVFANFDGAKNRVCLGDGFGSFTCSDVSSDTIPSSDVALGYINQDRHLDAVFTRFNARNRVCFGDGAGGFSCDDVSTDSFKTTRTALGYINNDQILDAVFSNESQQNRVCLGNGVGAFSCTDVSNDTADSNSVALGDLNGDQNLDAVFANWNIGDAVGDLNRVCLGDGNAGFSCSNVSSDENSSFDVALGLVDDDPFLDVVFANFPFGGTGENRICFGDGLGGFSRCSNTSTSTSFTYRVALGELNSPAAPLVFANGFEQE